MFLAAGVRRAAYARVAFVAATAISASFPRPLFAQVPEEAPAVTLMRPVSVRNSGMAGVGGALVGNAGAVFTNPAGLATIRHIGVEGGYRATPLNGNMTSGALAWRIRQFHLGFGFVRYKFGMDAGDQPIPGIPAGADAKEYAGIGSLVYRFGIIALAGSGKYVRRVVDDAPESAFSGDAGLAIAIFDIMAIGFSMQNIGGRWMGSRTIGLQQLTRLAMTWNYVDPLETFRLRSTVELQWPAGAGSRLVLGGEGGMVLGGVGLIARAGYAAFSGGSPYSRVAYGGSVTMLRLALDYAYQEGDLNGLYAHRFGFRMAL